MDDRRIGDTRERILQTALQLFAERGYGRTSLREIAQRLQLTKAAILYHFPSKAHLLTAIAQPLVDDLEAAVRDAEELPAASARWAVIEGWLDTLLTHRQSLGMLFHDLALIAQNPRLHKLIELVGRAGTLIVGPQSGDRERVRAIQALSMLGDPVFLTDIPNERLREHILDGVRRLLGEPPPSLGGLARTRPAREPAHPVPATRPRRRGVGRPRRLDAEQIAALRRMHRSGSHTVDEIGAAFGISRATVYRHLKDPDSPEI